MTWADCPALAPDVPPETRDPAQRCAEIRVPLDYRSPRGRHITITVSRVTAAKPELRRGVLLVNPGGPGVSALDFASLARQMLPPEVADRYDVVSFDPRGIGHSTAVTCGIDPTDPRWEGVDIVNSFPAPDGSIANSIVSAKAVAGACLDGSSKDVLPYVTTANTARDMDRIRVALGERRISYFGWSYGTHLGAAYAALFPEQADRIVLDSVVDPGLVSYDFIRTWSHGATTRFHDVARLVAAHPDIFGFGTTPTEVTQRFLGFLADLDREPVDIPGLGLVDGNLFRAITFQLLYYDHTAVLLAIVWKVLTSEPVAQINPEVLATLRGAEVAADVPADNGVAAYHGIYCGDAAWPRDVSTYARNVAKDRQRYPLMAGMPANITPCPYWTRPVEQPVRVSDRGPRNVLILQNRRDPVTPWENGLGLRRSFGQRAAMVGVDTGGHGTFGRGSCADELTTVFLTSGNLPAEDRFCAGPDIFDQVEKDPDAGQNPSLRMAENTATQLPFRPGQPRWWAPLP